MTLWFWHLTFQLGTLQPSGRSVTNHFRWSTFPVCAVHSYSVHILFTSGYFQIFTHLPPFIAFPVRFLFLLLLSFTLDHTALFAIQCLLPWLLPQRSHCVLSSSPPFSVFVNFFPVLLRSHWSATFSLLLSPSMPSDPLILFPAFSAYF